MARPRPVVGLLSGIAAGLVASAAMSLFRKQANNLIEQQSGETAGSDVAPVDPAKSTEAVHYAVGAVLGGMYGLLTEYHPDAGTGFGTAYGVATATILDQVAGAPDSAQEAAPMKVAVSHLVFGVVLEGMRTLMAGRR